MTETEQSTAPSTPTHDETPEALRHLGVVGATLVAILLVVYAVPPLARFRPWAPGDPLPFADHFQGQMYEAPQIATGGAQAGQDEDVSRRRIANELGAAVAGNMGGDSTPETHRGATIDPSEYEGLPVHLVDEGQRGLRPFYEALVRTARGEDGAITRIAHYGDSSIATDLITHTVRRRLQLRFGDAGHGFVLISKGYLPYRHRDLEHRFSDNWQVREVTKRSLEDGLYGFGGIQVRGGGGARATFGADPGAPVGKTVGRFQLFYQRSPRGGQVELVVDRGLPRVLDTRGDAVEDAIETIDVPDGDHELTIRALGMVTLYGMVLERNATGVVYDSLGLVGARANRLLNFDPEHIARQLRMRGTNLLVLGFGGNEASDSIDPATYLADFEQVIRRMRAGREDLGCLVVAPLDQAERVGTGIRTFRGLPRIVEAQRQAAARNGCAFFDTFAAMGGEGAMARWYRANPRLAMGDFRHATPEGYEIIGNMLTKALLEGFAEYLAAEARSSGTGGR